MGDVIPNNRFRRTTARSRKALSNKFKQRRPWEADHEKAMDEFARIVGKARKKR